jgi:hypothetical protein
VRAEARVWAKGETRVVLIWPVIMLATFIYGMKVVIDAVKAIERSASALERIAAAQEAAATLPGRAAQ